MLHSWDRKISSLTGISLLGYALADRLLSIDMDGKVPMGQEQALIYSLGGLHGMNLQVVLGAASISVRKHLSVFKASTALSNIGI